jgi:glutaredoxin 3
MPELILYHFEGCPYCSRVKDHLARNNIKIPWRDIHANPAYREELVALGGKAQVPCLMIDGKPLYESLDIIEWFKKNGGRT